VLDRLIRDGELSQIVSNHLRLDLNLVELFAAVNTNNRANHFRDDNHISKVCLNKIGLLIRLGFLLCFSEFFDQTHRAALEATVKSAAGTSVENVDKLRGGNVEELVEIDSSEGEFSEGGGEEGVACGCAEEDDCD